MGFLKKMKDAAEQGVERGQRLAPRRTMVPRTRLRQATTRQKKKTIKIVDIFG
jgi:hypothetical protein